MPAQEAQLNIGEGPPVPRAVQRCEVLVLPVLHAHCRPLAPRGFASCMDTVVFCSWELPAPIRARRPQVRRGGAHGPPGSVWAPVAPTAPPARPAVLLPAAPRTARRRGVSGSCPGLPSPPRAARDVQDARNRMLGTGVTATRMACPRCAQGPAPAPCGGAIAGSDRPSRRPSPGPARLLSAAWLLRCVTLLDASSADEKRRR